MSEMVDVGGVRAKITADISGYRQSIDQAKAKTAELGKAGKEASASFSALNGKLAELGMSSAQITKIGDALKKAHPEILRKQIAEVTAELKNLGATDAEISKITRELEHSTKGASGLSKEVKALGAAYGALAIAMGAVIAKAIETSRTFEQSMANVKAISQATGAEFEALRNQAIALGSSTVFSASQAADAQALLAQAGFKTNDIIAAMPGLLDLAAAGQTDLATTADIAASALNGFGLSAEQSGRVADVLAKASIDTNADITDLGMAMKYIAPVAASMGVSIEEATAAVGELSNAGIKGEMAGTQLRAMLLALASPSEEAAFYMQQLGVSLSDSSGKILPLSTVVGQLQGAFARLTQAQQADVAATLVGREAASGFLTLIANGKTTLDNYTASLQNSAGTAQQVADVQMDTLNGAINELQSALEGVGITVGDMFAPAIRKVAETITAALAGFNQLNPALQASIVAFPTATVAIGALVVGIYALRAALVALQVSFPILGAISLVIGAVVAGVSALVSHSNAAAESVKKHDEAQKSLNDTLNQSPVTRTVQELQDLQTKTEELNKVLQERAALQKELKSIESLQEKGLGTPQLLSEAMDINDELAEMDKKLREMGYDGVDDATGKLKQMREEIEKSTPALFELRKEEINELATKKQSIESAEKLIATYQELNAKQALDAQQKQELINTVNALRKQYPDLHALMDKEGRLRVDNLGIIEQQISADRTFMNQAVETQRVYLQNLITTTEQQRKSVEAQIRNYANLLSAMKAVSAAKITDGKGPVKGGVSPGLKMLNPSLAKFTEKFAVEKYEEVSAEQTALYDEQNRLREAELEMKRSLNSLTSGEFSSSGVVGGGINLSKPEKAKKGKTSSKKAKTGKTAAELAAEARKKAYDADVATIRYQAEMFDWSADRQIEAYEKLRKNHAKYLKESIEDRRTLDLQLKRLDEDTVKSRFDFSAEWIEKEERRMEESGKSEKEIAQMKLDAWTRVRDRYEKDSDLYKQADEQVYQARKKLTQQTVKLAENLVKTEKARIDDVKKREIEAIKKRKEAALDDYDARIKAIDELMAKEEEYNSDVDYETALAEKNARIDLLGSAVGPDGIQEREDLIKERDRMVLEHERDLRKRELESQKTAIQAEKEAEEAKYDRQISEAEAQYDALIEAFNSYSGDIKTIEAVLAEFRVSESAKANTQILTDLDAFVREYNAKMSQVDALNGDNDLTEYNANKDAYDKAAARGDREEMARLHARNEEIRKKYGITTDSGKKLQSFAVGGVVQGRAGEPVIAQVHAGEMVLNAQQQAVLFDALSGVVTRAPAQPSGSSTYITNHIDMGVDTVTLEDQADIKAFYDERARTVERLQTQGVKTR